MRSILLAVAIIMGISAPALANQVVYACQFTASSGLKWSHGNWERTNFQLRPPFFLTAVDNAILPESISKAFDTQLGFFCNPTFASHSREVNTEYVQTCSNLLGATMYFNFTTQKGAIADLFGAGTRSTMIDKDSVVTSTFICIKV